MALNSVTRSESTPDVTPSVSLYVDEDGISHHSEATPHRSRSFIGWGTSLPPRGDGLERWTSRVDMSEVMRTMRKGPIDLEKHSIERRPSILRGVSEVSNSETSTQTHFPVGSTRSIEEVPLGAIYATIVISYNAVIMLVAEIGIEVLVAAGVYPYIPFRLSFLVLTILSGLLGTQTLIAVNRKEFDTSHNALQVGLLVEVGLIAGDIEFLVNKSDDYPAALPTRVPFIILTFLNVCLVVYLYVKLRLYESRTAHVIPECVRPVELGLGTFSEFWRSIVPPLPQHQASWTLQDLGHAVVQYLHDENVRHSVHEPHEDDEDVYHQYSATKGDEEDDRESVAKQSPLSPIDEIKYDSVDQSLHQESKGAQTG